MFCVIYVLCRSGEKLPRDEVRRHPQAGWLYYGQNQKIHPETDAILYVDAAKQQELLRLCHATVKTIDRGGLLLRGSDAPRIGHTQRQAWWCVPAREQIVPPSPPPPPA